MIPCIILVGIVHNEREHPFLLGPSPRKPFLAGCSSSLPSALASHGAVVYGRHAQRRIFNRCRFLSGGGVPCSRARYPVARGKYSTDQRSATHSLTYCSTFSNSVSLLLRPCAPTPLFPFSVRVPRRSYSRLALFIPLPSPTCRVPSKRLSQNLSYR